MSKKEVYLFDTNIDICLPENHKILKQKLLKVLQENDKDIILHQDEKEIIINLSKNNILKIIKNNYQQELDKNLLFNKLNNPFFISMKNHCIITIKGKEYGFIIIENLTSLDINNLTGNNQELNLEIFNTQLSYINNIININKPIKIENLMLRRIITPDNYIIIDNKKIPLIIINNNKYIIVLVDL
jgi:hypothetical protein